MNTSNAPQIIHATTVNVGGRGVLILGRSGAGKSSLALQLISLGAQLVSDDRTLVQREGDGLVAQAPATIAGLIEARGVGLVKVTHAGATPLVLAVDLDQVEGDRLPQPHSYTLFDVTIPCLFNAPSPHFAAAILLWLQGGIGLPT